MTVRPPRIPELADAPVVASAMPVTQPAEATPVYRVYYPQADGMRLTLRRLVNNYQLACEFYDLDQTKINVTLLKIDILGCLFPYKTTYTRMLLNQCKWTHHLKIMRIMKKKVT